MKLDMIILVNNETYDNDDNPYGKFVLHMYTNMKDIKDRSTDDIDEDGNASETLYGFEDREIPLIICPTQINTSWRKSNIKQYCPSYVNNDFLYGNFYTKRFAWMRLALHFCDDSPEA